MTRKNFSLGLLTNLKELWFSKKKKKKKKKKKERKKEKMRWKKYYNNGYDGGPWFDTFIQKNLHFLDRSPFK